MVLKIGSFTRPFFLLNRRQLAFSFNLIQSSRLASTMSNVTIDSSKYPLARRDESIVDDFHGTKVLDPYRWMEDPDAKETQEFVDALNKVSSPIFAETDIREKLKDKLTALWDYEKYSCIGKHSDYYYYWYNSGLQNQSVLYQTKDYKQKGKVFFDPNILSSDGTTAIRNTNWTEDGKIWGYGLSEKGSDWMTLKFKTDEGVDLPDVITGVKFSSISWLGDNSGLFYSRFPEHKSATEGSSVEKHEYHSLYFHKLGTSQDKDFLVADFRHDPLLMHDACVTKDGRYLIVDVNKGCDPTNQVFYFDLKSVNNQLAGKVPLKPLFDKFDAKYSVVDTDDDTALVITNKDAPMNKLIRVKFGADNNDPANWTTVIDEDPKRKLNMVCVAANDKLIVGYLEDCCSKLYVNDKQTGKMLKQIPLEIGSLSGISCEKDRTEVFFSFESYLIPTVIYRFDFAESKVEDLKIEEVRRVQIKGFDPSKFMIEQAFATSKDGTKVPMFIVRPKIFDFNGQHPTILNGYGGFNVAEEPYFSISRCLFLSHFDGVVACSNLRGGSEYGEKWHEGGMLERKQNVFDDYISCAEYLIEKRYTSPKKLCIHGGSNGGLLVAACSQQRPDLYGAVLNRVGVMDMLRFHKFTVGSAWIPEYAVLNRVGVMDMLRFHKFTVGSAWIPEYGNPDKKEHFDFIYKYSPLHNIRVTPGVQWPATLMMTADHDDRVIPAHTLKYAAQLYHTIRKDGADFQKNPIICRVEVKAGHGAGKPTAKVISEIVDMYCFLYRVLAAKYVD
uniref:Prolyl endopeptidase n=1 Tax=Panagrolaimus sp. JU765 TaxID=591449 RepID=A0AC34QS36_9BILA